MKDIINNIHDLFIEEAKKSPLLFNDLASMENYISESYSGRSIIELLQNADDAKAQRILFKKVNDNVCIVANDGHFFTDEDLLALCRSGASTKKRQSETIGYRGIGFKSVVNYADVVHLVSGEIRATFSRALTKAELDNADKIPLIRVPHKFYDEEKYKNEINELVAEGFNTVFVFEVKSNMFSKEINEFTEDSLIFLNSVNEVVMLSEQGKKFSVIRKQHHNREKIITIQGSQLNGEKSWLVIENEDKTGRISLAFKYEGKRVYKAERDEAVIHSFLPTNDRLSIKIKINGDFSTDPSRTRIVQDEATLIANKKSAELIATVFDEILKNSRDQYGLLSVLKDASIDPLVKIKGASANDVIIGFIIKEVQEVIKRYARGKKVLLQPAGITDDDFDRIIDYVDAVGIGNEQEENVADLRDFLKAIGIEELSMEECLKAMKDIECSDGTRSTVIAETIKETKLAMNEKQKELISNAKLFRFEDGVKSVEESAGSKVEDIFEGTITEKLTTNTDYTAFAKKIGLQDNQLAINNQVVKTEHNIKGVDTIIQTESFKEKKTIKKWRTVEKNVAAVLELMDDVTSVRDVSEQNIGYDLEAIISDGSRRYYEVKSVERLGDNISFSNNEYSTCVSLKGQYYLAIAAQASNEISICFIKNPVDTLHFEKRVTRWDWMCGDYTGEVINTSME